MKTMLSWSFAGLLCLAAVAASAAPITVPLAPVALSNSAVVLSANSFDEADTNTPIHYYMAFGNEVVLPKAVLVLDAKNPKREIKAAGTACTFELRDGAFLGGVGAVKAAEIPAAGLGLRSLPLGADGAGLLAVPRAFTHEGAGRIYYRSGNVRSGTLDGTEIRLYDDDLDGKFVKGRDGLAIGDRGGIGVFGTLGELLPTTQAVYTVTAVAADGSALTLDAFAGPAGRLRLAPIPNVECRLAFASEDGKCSFGMLAGGPGLAVPAGKYRCLYGLLFRPSARHVVGVVLPSRDLPVIVGAGEEVNVTLGDLAKKDLPWGEGVVTMDFRRLLAVDLTAAEDAADAGDFAKAQQLLDAVIAKFKIAYEERPIPSGVRATFKPSPNCAASEARLLALLNCVEYENGPYGVSLRAAEEKARAALKEGKPEDAKAALAEAQKTLAAAPSIFTSAWNITGHRNFLGILERAAAGGPKPGVKLTTNAGKKNQTVEAVANVDWTDPQGQGWGHTRLYEGALVVPVAGEYEIAVESIGTLTMTLDGQKFIEHPYHLPAERTVKVTLTAGAHPFRIDAQCYVYGYTHANKPHMLRLRWTPPDGRKAVIPAWAFQTP